MIDHSGHPHPSTPAARALCRANGGTGDITKKPSTTKAKSPTRKKAAGPGSQAPASAPSTAKTKPTLTQGAAQKPVQPQSSAPATTAVRGLPTRVTGTTVRAARRSGIGAALTLSGDDQRAQQARRNEQLARLDRIAARQASGGQRVKAASNAKITKSVQSGIAENLGGVQGGMVAQTSKLRFNDGSLGIQKTLEVLPPEVLNSIPAERRKFMPTAKDGQDNEELGTMVARGLGLDAAEVYRVDEVTTIQELKPGKVGAEFRPREQERIINSDDGLVIAVMDQVIGNNDRNTGNWLVNGDRIVPIDFSGAWAPSEVFINPVESPLRLGTDDFARSIRDERTGDFKNHDLSPADMNRIGEVLESLRPEFAKRGRTEQLDWSLRRLAALSKYATGTKRRIK